MKLIHLHVSERSVMLKASFPWRVFPRLTSVSALVLAYLYNRLTDDETPQRA